MRSRVLGTLVLLLGVASAQAAPRAARALTGVRFARTATVTVQQLMARTYHYPTVRHEAEDEKGLKEPDFTKLKRNPRSPKANRYPIGGLHPGPGGDPAIVFGTNTLAIDAGISGYTPPDSMGAIGPSQFLLIVNGRIRVYDKSGNLGALDAATDTFWSSVIAPGDFVTDPRAIFDPTSGRWIIVMVTAATVPNNLLIAWSSGPVITGSTSFTLAAIPQDFGAQNPDTGNFADYPTMGVDANAIYIGCNMFKASTGTYYSSTGFVIPKSYLFAGEGQIFDIRDFVSGITGGPYGPQGVSNFVSHAQGKGYFIGVDALTSGLLDVVTIANPGTLNPTYSGMTSINIPMDATSVPVSPPGSLSPISSDDFRLMGANIAQNVLDGTFSLFCVHHIGVDSLGFASSSATQDAAQWFQIDLFATGGPALLQSAILYDSGGNSVLYPSVSMNNRGDVLMGFTLMGPGQTPRAEVLRRVTGDAPGAFPMSATAIGSGFNTFNMQSGLQRWGDYSFTSLDPTDGMTMWTVQEYVPASDDWGVQITQVKAPPPPALASIVPSMVAHGYAGKVTINGTTNQGGAFVEPSADLAPYKNDIKLRFGGLDLANGVVPTVVNATQLQVNLFGPSVNSANYGVTVTNPDGQQALGTATLQVVPGLTAFSVDLTTVSAGTTINATLTLDQNPTVDEPISLSAPAGAPVTLPPSITIPAGHSNLSFAIPTTKVKSSQTFQIIASDPGNVHSFSVSITVNPVATLFGLGYAPATIQGGAFTTGWIEMIGNEGAAVTISGGGPYVSYPATVTVPQGVVAQRFVIKTLPVPAQTTVTLTATYGSVSKSANLTLTLPSVVSFTLSPSPVAGGSPSIGLVRLSGVAPVGGYSVALSGATSGVTFPLTVTVPAGSNVVKFMVATSAIDSGVTVPITATFGNSVTSSLTVTPAYLYGLGFAPATVTGGTSTTGWIALAGKAGPSGVVVSIGGGGAGISFPSTVFLPPGTSNQRFWIKTIPVSSKTTVTISATQGTVSKASVLTID